MLKPSYDREDQIPENLKGAYVADASGVFVLDKLDAEHPVVKKNAELARENTAFRGTNTKLANEKAQLEARSIPEGYVAVKAEDAPIIEKLKATGVSLEELPTLKNENDEFKRAKAEAESLNVRCKAAERLGYNQDAFAALAKNLDIVSEGDKDFVNVKNDKGEIEKKPLTKEFVEASETFQPFMTSLTQQPKSGASPDPKIIGAASNDEAGKQAERAMASNTLGAF